jgi:hypothetical protein
MNKNCIVMVAIQEEASKYDHQKYFEASKECWQSYCKKHNIDFIVVDKKLPNVKFCVWHKEFVFDFIGDKYEKIALVDFDTLVHWDAPNFFDLYNDEFCGVLENESLFWIQNSLNAFRDNFAELRNVEITLSEYINGGVLFFHKSHKNFFEKLKAFYIQNKPSFDNWNVPNTGKEQTILNLYLKKENITKKYLDFRFNTMRLTKNDWLHHNWQIDGDKTPFFIKYSYIWHFTGCSIEERTNLMTSIWQQTKHLYG